MNKNAIFIHAALLDGVEKRIEQYITKIFDSKLICIISVIYINFIGNSSIPQMECLKHDKIKIISTSSNLLDYELPTIQYLWDFSVKNPEYKILYLHTKGIGKTINLCIEDQIEYMLYFLITNWQYCINKLNDNDTIGVDLRNKPVIHYSGNFWWANGSYILTLPSPEVFNDLNKYPNPLNSLRHNQEFWICYNKKKHYSLFDCKIDVYERHLHRFEKSNYTNLNLFDK